MDSNREEEEMEEANEAAITGALKINELDKEIATLKDRIITLEKQNTNLVDNFKILYQTHESLIGEIQQSIIAVNITLGKIAEATAKYRIQLPTSTSTTQ